MRTVLAISFSQTSNIPGIRAHAHDLPGYPNVTCIDFMNGGNNRELPATLQNIMLVPESQQAPHLGLDRTLYTVPDDYQSVSLMISIGIIEDKDFVVAQMTITLGDGETITHTHVTCELP